MKGGGILSYMCMPAGLFLLKKDEANSKSEINFDYDSINNSDYKILSVYHIGGAF